MSKKVLITGISGFIGRHLAKKLASIGYNVTGISTHPFIMDTVSVIQADILDAKKIQEICKGKDILIHLAAVTTHDELANKTEFSKEVNYTGTKNLLNAFEGAVFIYPSSGKVYGKQDKLPFSEHMKPNPTTILGKMKLQIEELIGKNSKKNKNYTVLRIFNVYGPEQRKSFLIPTIISQLNKKEIVLGDIKGKRDFIYIDDVVEAFVLIIKSNISGFNVFNVGSGKSVNPKGIVDIFSKITNKKLTIKIDDTKLRMGEFDEERADISQLKTLKWESKVNMEEGLRKILGRFSTWTLKFANQP